MKICRRTSSLVYFILCLGIMFCPFSKAFAQKVGLVLSGGGATGIAHVGVIKALEENNIPIDYIVGTSMGALVGGLYAAGYSPQEMERIFLSESFKKMTDGEIDEKYRFFYKEDSPNPSLASLKFFLDSAFQTSLPTNVISPITLDFELMELLMGPNANANGNFDSLMIPYRCIAADIVSKRQVVFKEGDLSQSIRASMSYPFFLKPISVNGVLMFDGGLYNNFPSDVMYDDFLPDIIIGSDVSDQLDPPSADDIISQIKNMLITRGNSTVICENGILIQPRPNVATFDFKNADVALEAGYKAAMDSMYGIKNEIERRVKKEHIEQQRFDFRKEQPIPLIDKIEINGLKPNQASYVRKMLGKPKEKILLYDLKPKYYRMFSDAMINFAYPSIKFNRATGYYDLYLDLEKENDLIIDFGGNFSSRPINTGFIGLKYHLFGKRATTVTANSYFGKFYGSIKLGCRIDFPSAIPFFIEPEGSLSRWDFFKSQATFFEDVKPSFLVQNERYFGLTMGVPLHYQGRLSLDAKMAELEYDYYQTEGFKSTDTSDNTSFSNQNIGILYEFNSLNRKQFASDGTHLSLGVRYVFGEEITEYGSTYKGKLKKATQKHGWVMAKLNCDHYLELWSRYKLGFHAEAGFSGQNLTKKPFFSNFTATMLVIPAFEPIPETKTLFKKQLRAQNYGAIGLKNIFEIRKNLEVRLEAYLFQPYQSIIEKEDNRAAYGPILEDKFVIGSSTLFFKSPLGPISFSANYYHFDKEKPFSFLFNFGYILFNKRVLN